MSILDFFKRAKLVPDEKKVASLIKALGSKDEAARKKARESLIGIGSPAVERLVQALKSSEWNVRMNAALALGKIGDVRAVEPLLQGLNEDIRIQAIVALGDIGDKKAEKPLFDALQDQNDNARAFAVEALGKMGHMDPLVRALDDISDFVRRTAVQALARTSNPNVVDYLARPLRSSRDWATRLLIAKTLGDLGNTSAKGALTEALRDENQMVREAAQLALNRLGEKKQ